ncbi:MAG: carboxynorspermidine decarboxylase [Bacteroidales bacterium]|nr:carboxynorspermidine decarboxylase [Bacteroidales bacterium]MCM1147012.1 carboxynorspermidine decarboxylase [Bacteroidales bacterium]MCM1205855.1 carboxynorspermidine decarboxylase [Bacillota bacterium]MCM1509904.1 carboxynorspermidine decarboxylase [Clostridium sp.]
MDNIRTPYFCIDAERLEQNLRVLRGVMDSTGCRILLAQKCFSCYGLYPLISEYLAGATASGIFEARLWHEEGAGENHIFSPAFREEDMDGIFAACDHIDFNSPRQLSLYGRRAKEAGLQVGLRINPECSTQEGHAIYDPCAPGSRLGTTLAEFERTVAGTPLMELLDGLHFHTLCEQNSDDLEKTLDAVEEKFGKYLHGMSWINFGGGHHITRDDYDIPRLERCIFRMQDKYGLAVYLEPGEAVALNAGTLHSSVLEVQPEGSDGVRNVILDTSAACHMPDVIEMPYTPPLERVNGVRYDAEAEKCDRRCKYRFGGPTCLSGDVIGTYDIQCELTEGDEVVFGDMAIYSMVKTNTFNGMPLPDIYMKKGETLSLWKRFSYDDFKKRV